MDEADDEVGPENDFCHSVVTLQSLNFDHALVVGNVAREYQAQEGAREPSDLVYDHRPALVRFGELARFDVSLKHHGLAKNDGQGLLEGHLEQ